MFFSSKFHPKFKFFFARNSKNFVLGSPCLPKRSSSSKLPPSYGDLSTSKLSKSDPNFSKSISEAVKSFTSLAELSPLADAANKTNEFRMDLADKLKSGLKTVNEENADVGSDFRLKKNLKNISGT